MTQPDNEQLHDAHARLLALAQSSITGPTEHERPDLPDEVEFPTEDFGPYRLVRVLGHGGQGVVYRAVDTRLDREVALKLLSAHGAATATSRARFERETATVSRLRHPNLCTVYEAGEIDGQRYLAMELVDGQSLHDWADSGVSDGKPRAGGERRARVIRALELVEQVARAVHTAHQAGIVHRDLKPANVMLRRDGSPVVLDFGLAGDESDSDAGLTEPGDVLGTPAYMPPERVRGEYSAADPREDVYGLGAILYECLTGELPFEGNTREQLYRRILTDRVADPRRSNPAVPPEAHHVLVVALEKETDRRYASAEAFADDVGRLRRREPIHARPVPVWTRATRWVRRDPRVAVPALAAFALLLAGVLVTLVLLAQVRVESGYSRMRALLAASTNELERDPQLALLLVHEVANTIAQDAPDDLRVEMRSAQMEALARARRIADFDHPGKILGEAITADGSRLAIVTQNPDDAPALVVYSTETGDRLGELAIDSPRESAVVRSAAFDSERDRVLITAADGAAYVCSCEDATLLHTLPRPSSAGAQFTHSRIYSQFKRAGNLGDFVPGRAGLVVTGTSDGLRLWELPTGSTGAEELWHDARSQTPGKPTRAPLSQIAISRDGRLCASGSHDGWVRVVRLKDGRLLGEIRASAETIRIMAFDPHRPLLLTSAIDQQGVRIWNVDRDPADAAEPLEEIAALELPDTWARHVRFAPSHEGRPTVLAVADNDQNLRLYEPRDGDLPYAETAQSRHGMEARSLAFSPDGRRLALGAGDSHIEIYDRLGLRIDELYGAVMGGNAAWSPRGNRIVTTGWRHIQIWRTEDPIFPVVHLPRPVSRMAVAGERVVVGMHDGSIAVLDPGQPPRIARGEVDIRNPSFALRPDGQQLAVGGNWGRFDLWDLSGAAPVRLVPEHVDFRDVALASKMFTYDDEGRLQVAVPRPGDEDGHVLAFDAEGRIVADWEVPGYGALGGTLVRHGRRTSLLWKGSALWDVEAATAIRASPSPFGVANLGAPSVSSDGRTLMLTAIGAGFGTLSFVDLERREVVRQIDHLGPATDAALSADASRAVVPARRGQAKLWDLRFDPPRLVTELRGHVGTVWAARFSADGRQIITVGHDRTVRWWPASFDHLDALVEQRLIRDWTEAERVRYGIDSERSSR